MLKVYKTSIENDDLMNFNPEKEGRAICDDTMEGLVLRWIFMNDSNNEFGDQQKLLSEFLF